MFCCCFVFDFYHVRLRSTDRTKCKVIQLCMHSLTHLQRLLGYRRLDFFLRFTVQSMDENSTWTQQEMKSRENIFCFCAQNDEDEPHAMTTTRWLNECFEWILVLVCATDVNRLTLRVRTNRTRMAANRTHNECEWRKRERKKYERNRHNILVYGESVVGGTE